MKPQNPTRTFDNLLFHVAEETFGELAFMLVIPDDLDDTPAEPVQWGYAAKVKFTGPFGGEVQAAITSDMLRPLASNMLGIDENEDPPEGVKVEDALKELLNVICGNLLPAIAGEEVVFNIAGPELLDTPQLVDDLEGLTFAGRTELTLDSGQAEVRLFVNCDDDVPTPGMGG